MNEAPGKGLQQFGGGGHGDLNLRIQVRIPEKLSDEERELYQQLGSLSQTVTKKSVGGNSTGHMFYTDYRYPLTLTACQAGHRAMRIWEVGCFIIDWTPCRKAAPVFVLNTDRVT